MASPIEQYRNDQQQLHFSADIAQANAIEDLQRLYLELCALDDVQNQPRSLSQRIGAWAGGHSKQQAATRGLYFWGGVVKFKEQMTNQHKQTMTKHQKGRHFHNK